MKLIKLKKILASLTATALALTTMAFAPATVSAETILNDSGTHTFVLKSDGSVDGQIKQYSTPGCNGSYDFSEDDIVNATITTSVSDTSGWQVAITGFTTSWGGWQAVYSEQGTLTISTTIADVMAANSISSISNLGGISLQVWGTAEGDVVNYTITVEEGTPPVAPDLEDYEYDFDEASGTVAAGTWGQPAKTAVGDDKTITKDILGGSFTVVVPYTGTKKPKLTLSDGSGNGALNWIQVDPDVTVNSVAYFKKATALSAWQAAGGSADFSELVMLFIAAQDAELTVTDVKLYSSVAPAAALYTVTIDPAITNGSVTADKTTDLSEGDKVTLTVTPAEGYILDSISATASDGSKVTISETDYSFTMPAADVNVTASFVEKPDDAMDYTLPTDVNDMVENKVYVQEAYTSSNAATKSVRFVARISRETAEKNCEVTFKISNGSKEAAISSPITKVYTSVKSAGQVVYADPVNKNNNPEYVFVVYTVKDVPMGVDLTVPGGLSFTAVE